MRRTGPTAERFEVEDDHLLRYVTPPSGRSYVHRCSRYNFESVCYQIEDAPDQGATMESLAEALDIPYTQVNVALEFLKERGCVVVRRRRSYPASNYLHADAMTEFYALHYRLAAGR